jgi:hypothetical protein
MTASAEALAEAGDVPADGQLVTVRNRVWVAQARSEFLSMNLSATWSQ